MHITGITGGIGSGKSSVAAIFESLGYLIYKADDRSKFLLMNDEGVIAQVAEAFGSKMLDESGTPDRKKLAAAVFSRPKKLAALNAILHPAVRDDFDKWVQAVPHDYRHRFVCKEAAILFEAGSDAGCDQIVEVYAPKLVRLARVMQRDQAKASEVLARMSRQWPEMDKVLRCDYLLINDGEHALIPQVMQCAAWLNRTFEAKPPA